MEKQELIDWLSEFQGTTKLQEVVRQRNFTNEELAEIKREMEPILVELKETVYA